MNVFSGAEYMPMHPMASPISVVDIFFPGFSALNATAQQLLLNNTNGYVRLLCIGAVFAIFARYAYRYTNDLISKYFSSFSLIEREKMRNLLTDNSPHHSRVLL
jgi:chaperone BCS1